MRFSERFKILALTESADVTTNGVDTQSVNFGKLNSGCFIINTGTVTSDDALKVYVGAATATKTTAVAFSYRLAAADTKSALSDTFGAFTAVAFSYRLAAADTKSALSDTFGAFTAVASTGLTLAAATFDHKCYIVEVDAQAIPDATPWVTLEIAGSASAQNISIVFIGEPRFASNSGTPTVI